MWEVLVVEDNPADVYLLQYALEELRAPCHLTVTQDGDEAMRLLVDGGQLPDLVVLDLHLPRKSGDEVLAEMKADARLRSIPVAVLSSVQSPADAQRIRELQASAFLTKPSSLDEYLELGRALLALLQGKG